MTRFAGKVAIVTGGLSGIGAAVVSRLVAEGARAVAADLSVREGAIPDGDGPVFPVHLDVADPGSCTAMVSSVTKRFGKVDALVNAAGSPASRRSSTRRSGISTP